MSYEINQLLRNLYRKENAYKFKWFKLLFIKCLILIFFSFEIFKCFFAQTLYESYIKYKDIKKSFESQRFIKN